MKTLMKKKLLPSFMAAGLVLSSNVQAIHVAGDGVGQLLMAPLYSTLDGRVTKVAIYNTSDAHAVKVKVSIRSYGHSIEVRDFICYMSPADVCRFEFMSEDGIQYLTSTDDSVRNQDGKFASESPLKIPFELSKMKEVDSSDTAAYGHFEVYGVYGVVNGTSTGSGSVQRGMSKYSLAGIFDNTRVANASISSVNPEFVRLSGDVVIESSDGERLSYQIPALVGKSGDNTVLDNGTPLMDPNTNVQFDGRVIANVNYDAEGTQTTPVGQGFGIGGSDNIYEIEYALASTNITGTYEVGGEHSADTRVYVTFPTKYRHRGNDICGVDSDINPARYSAPFSSAGTVSFKIYEYDNQENRTEGYFSPSTTGTLYAEVNDFYPNGGWAYDSGYYDMVFQDAACEANGLFNIENGTSVGYVGMPVLAMTYKQNNAGAFLVPSAFNRLGERSAKNP